MRSHPFTPPPPVPAFLAPLTDELSAILPNQRTHLPSSPRQSTGSSRRPASADSAAAGLLLDDLDPDTSRLLPVRRKQHHVRVQGRLAVVRSVSTVDLRLRSKTQPPASPAPYDDSGDIAGATGRSSPNRTAEAAAVAGPSRTSTRSDSTEGAASQPRRVRRASIGTVDEARSPKKDRTMRRVSRIESAVAGEIKPRRKRKPTSHRKSLMDGLGRSTDALDGHDSDAEEEEMEISARDSQLRGYGIGGMGNIRRPTEVMFFPSSRKAGPLGLPEGYLGSFSGSPARGDQDKTKWNLRDMLGLPRAPRGKSRAK